MIEKKTTGAVTVLTATEGLIHKTGTDTYARTIVMLPGDTDDMYEEVPEIPPYTKAEYDAKVSELVRQRYTADEEFAIQRKMLNTLLSPMTMSDDTAEKAVDEYAAYNTYVEQCKLDAPDAILADIERRKAEDAERLRLEEEEAERQRLEALAEVERRAAATPPADFIPRLEDANAAATATDPILATVAESYRETEE